LIHEAFIYSSEDEYAAVLAPFLSEAVLAGQPAVAVASPERIGLLRDALGADQSSVSFFDADEWYRTPGAALASWRATLDAHAGAQPVRAIGEVTFAGDAAAVARWTRYESLLNAAFAGRSAWIVCPYDTRSLPEQIVADAHCTHPTVSTAASGRAPSPEHFAGRELGASLAPGAARPGARLGVTTTIAPGGDPLDARRAVVWAARSAGLSAGVVDDLLLAVREVAAASPSATIRCGRAGGEWFCEVAPVGAGAGAPLDESALGVVIGRMLCERVEIEHGTGGPLVRFVFGTPKASPSERILAASTELFAENGVRGTGINAIISRADVAKATFYAQFGSKDDLVTAWLQSVPVRWFDAVRTELEVRTTSPAERLTLLFEVVGEWLAFDDFHGCQILNTALESRLGGAALLDLHAEIEEYLRSTAHEAELADPDALAAQLAVLVAGTIASATARRSAQPAAAGRLAAEALVAAKR
jgi:AcrR family transcriptional regulator